MAGRTVGERTRIDVLWGTLAVMVVLMVLVMLGQGHMGHTRTMNFDLQPPHLVTPKPPAWM